MQVKVREVCKSFPTEEGPVSVLQGVNLDVSSGEQVAITGESGSGKSTLLYLIGALDSYDSGDIRLGDQSLTNLDDAARAKLRRYTVGVIFQQYNLIPSLTVLENLRFYARLCGREDKSWNEQISKRLGLEAFHNRYPEHLSGGQQQRVAIGRVLAAKPQLVLADEPTGNLDEGTSNDVIKLMLELATETKSTLLMVTHSKDLAGRMERHVHLSGGKIA